MRSHLVPRAGTGRDGGIPLGTGFALSARCVAGRLCAKSDASWQT
jgi:hypothetical protein